MDLIAPTVLLKAAMWGYAVAALGGLLAVRKEKLANAVGFGIATLAGLCGAMAAVLFLFSGQTGQSVSFDLWPSLVPYLRLSVKLDALSAFFLLIVSVLATALSIYSFGYVKTFYGRKSVGILGAFYNALLLATTLVFV